MGSIADVFAKLRLDTTNVVPDLKKGVTQGAQEQGKASGQTFGKSFVSGVGAVLAAGEIAKFFRSAFAEAQEAAKVTKLTAAAIQSTGGAARVTSADVAALSGRLSDLAGIDDEVIQSSANVLLTFTRVRNEVGKGNDIFNQAEQAALDMSVALGQDLQSSVVQVGKALNDPIQGLSALRRVGVAFTAEQKEQIQTLVESGQVMEAQKLILRELTTEFGGAAAAAATPADKATVAWGNFQEMIGGKVLPVLNDVLQFGLDNQQWLVPFIAGVGGLAAVIGTVVAATKAWTVVQSALGIGLEGTAVKAKRAAVGVGAFAVAVTAVAAAIGEDVNAQLDALADGLVRFGQDGQVAGEVARLFGERLELLQYDLGTLSSSGMAKFGNAVAGVVESTGLGSDFDQSLTHARERVSAIDQALADLVQSGHGQEAANAFARIAHEAIQQGISLDDLKAGFPAFFAAVEHGAAANRDLADATRDAAKAGDKLLDTWNELNGTMLSADEAALEATNAIDDVKEAFQSGGKAVQGNSKAVLENRVALETAAQKAIEAAAAYVRNGGSAADAAALVQRFKDQAVSATGATGANAAAVRALADQLFRIPENVSSTVLITTIKRTIYEESTVQHSRRAGGAADFANGAVVKFFAGGGLENHVAQIVKAGTYRVFGEPETGGEAYIPLAPSKRGRSTDILAEVARQFGYGLSRDDGSTVAAPTYGGGGSDWGRVLGALRRIEAAVYTVAPGVGQHINGVGTQIRTAGRTR